MATRPKQLETTVADEIAANCLAGRVRLLSRAITGIYDDALRPLGITAGQLNTLVFIAKKGPVAPGALARRLSMEKSTLSRNLARMHDQGWIRISPGESGNTQIVELCAKGRTLMEKSRPLWRQAQARAEQVLGDRGVRSLHRAADAVAASGVRS